ncbi:MAG: DUF4292 domain-containing protein [Deltaproteobacteria bacterium]|nr:DUF4292 domain-containing protein [Deltaproteobacteria bacterium]
MLPDKRVLLALITIILLACGPVPPPENAYTNAEDLLDKQREHRDAVRSFRITGRVDHFGEEHRIQGKVYLFAELPGRLRIELVSPFGNPMSVLTVNKGIFALHDLREGRYLTGPAEPCNIARLVRIPLPPDDVARILIGHTPLIDGNAEVEWDTDGFYQVTIHDGEGTQHLEIGPSRKILPLKRSRLKDPSDATVFDITYDRWNRIGDASMPHEIHIVMPRDKADLLLRYDDEGVELNVDLPEDAWDQSPPPGVKVEQVTCD